MKFRPSKSLILRDPRLGNVYKGDKFVADWSNCKFEVQATKKYSRNWPLDASILYVKILNTIQGYSNIKIGEEYTTGIQYLTRI